MTTLSIRDLSVGYERPHAVIDGVSLVVRPGKAVAIVGRNGAGKTTLVRSVAGQLPPWSGEVLVDDHSLRGGDCAARVRAGIATVPEGRQIFESLTVVENLRVAALGARLTLRRDAAENIVALFPTLGRLWYVRANGLSGGEQQMLALARALVIRPRFLIMDEPSLGLAPLIVKEIGRAIGKLVAGGLGVCVVEQNQALVEALCDDVIVLAGGRVARTMTGSEFRSHHHSLDYVDDDSVGPEGSRSVPPAHS
ncbi:MAG: ABC transporter ATP-binding protein [Acidimicrobiales bacterium]